MTLWMRPRRNDEADKAKWPDLADAHDFALTGLAYTADSGWRGIGSGAEPYALRFPGVTGAYGTTPTFAMSGGEWSFDIVFRSPTGATSPSASPVVVSHGISNTCGWYLRHTLETNAITLYLQRNGAQQTATIPGGTFARDQWHHLLCVVSNSALTLTCYRNGVKQTPKALVAPMVPADARALVLANYYPAYTQPYNWGGDIAAFRTYYTRCLSDAEAAQNYAAGPNGTGYVKSGLTVDLNAAYVVPVVPRMTYASGQEAFS